MRLAVHPEYHRCIVSCACGNTFETRATAAELHVEVCSNCHPFYTGQQRLVDTAGRVERFKRKYGIK
ncbi:MAG: 50S ribosomal protein L31 [Candidatus Binataceae bacterium]